MKSLGKRKDKVNTVDKAWHEFWKKRKKKKKPHTSCIQIKEKNRMQIWLYSHLRSHCLIFNVIASNPKPQQMIAKAF